MSYDYKVTECSLCKKTLECVSVWSNIRPWLCEDCCSIEGEYWSREQEDEENER